jgi:hypothetical protein
MSKKIVKYKGKIYSYPRDYKDEYNDRTSVQKKNRVKRRQARNKMIKKHGESALRGKDVDHIHGIGGGNGHSNLRITSKSFNRGRKLRSWR